MSSMGKILVVDDDPAVVFTLKEVLGERGHRTVTAASGVEALARLEDVDVVLTDLQMPAMDGLELLRKLREHDAHLPVVLVTSHGSERIAVTAMKAGAYDYVTKPFDIDEIAMVAERALEARQLRTANRRLVVEQALGRRLIAESAPMRRLLDAVERIGARDVTVLVRGETGTGKELIASLLHAHSSRAARPLVRFNCAAIPGELAEAELFGHARGAFTGAQAARKGFFSEADGASSSTRSASCRQASRPSSCAPSRTGRSSPSARARSTRSTCASWRRPIATSRPRHAPAGCARICTTVWPSSTSWCPRSASGATTSRRWPRSSRAATARSSASRICASRRSSSRSSWRPSGRGTCGSSRTPSPA